MSKSLSVKEIMRTLNGYETWCKEELEQLEQSMQDITILDQLIIEELITSFSFDLTADEYMGVRDSYIGSMNI